VKGAVDIVGVCAKILCRPADATVKVIDLHSETEGDGATGDEGHTA